MILSEMPEAKASGVFAFVRLLPLRFRSVSYFDTAFCFRKGGQLELVEKAHRKVFAPLFSKSGWGAGAKPRKVSHSKSQK